MSADKPAWYRQLWIQVFIAMLAGALLGWLDPRAGVAMQPLGDVFIKAIRLLIAPLIFCTIVHGIAGLRDSLRVGRLALRTLIYFEVMTTAALFIALLLVNLLKPGAGMQVDLSHVAGTAAAVQPPSQASGVVPFLLDIVPGSFFGAFVGGNVLQVLFVAVLFGFALIQLGERGEPLLRLIGSLSQWVFSAVNLIMWTASLGAFGAMAFTVGKFGVGSLWSLGRLVGEFYFICVVFIVVALGSVAALCGFSLFKLMRYLREEILVCIATTSSEVVLPRLILKMEQAGCHEGVTGLVVPAGYSFNLDGTCLYLATTAVFLAQATGTHLDIAQQLALLLILLVTSKGAAGISGAAFVVLAATLSAQHSIPAASVALVLGVHRLLSQGLTPTNFIGNAVATVALARWERALDPVRFEEALNPGRKSDPVPPACN